MIATLWSLWLARNDLMFKGYRIRKKNLELMIKQRSFNWGLSFKLISSNHANIWYIDPNSALSNNIRQAKKKLLDFWLDSSELVGFIDGA